MNEEPSARDWCQSTQSIPIGPGHFTVPFVPHSKSPVVVFELRSTQLSVRSICGSIVCKYSVSPVKEKKLSTPSPKYRTDIVRDLMEPSGWQ